MQPRTVRRCLSRAALGAVLLAGVVAGVLGVWRPWAVAPAEAPPVAAAEAPAIAPLPLDLPEHPRVLVFGDSWTYGSAASVPTLGYAYVLAELIGGETIVDGVRGSGYLKPGIDGPSFGERMKTLDATLDPDLVIVQGSINDRREGAAGYREAVDAAWSAMTERYPEAAIVILGPAPQVLPVETETARIDRDLQALAAARGWWYISPVQDEWITEQNYAAVIDAGAGRRHPSTDGHRYLAEKVAAALQSFAEAPVTSAGGSEEAS